MRDKIALLLRPMTPENFEQTKVQTISDLVARRKKDNRTFKIQQMHRKETRIKNRHSTPKRCGSTVERKKENFQWE